MTIIFGPSDKAEFNNSVLGKLTPTVEVILVSSLIVA